VYRAIDPYDQIIDFTGSRHNETTAPSAISPSVGAVHTLWRASSTLRPSGQGLSRARSTIWAG